MSAFLAFTIVGLVTGAVYALTASGLVITYTTSGIFNFAHGAIGMLAAYLYWELSVSLGLPVLVALPLVLLVGAPLTGALIERVLIRPLHSASLESSLIVTTGLLLFLVAAATLVWNPLTARVVPAFFGQRSVNFFGTAVTWHELIIIISGVLVAVALRTFFRHFRTGVAMRAVVDDPELLALTGTSPYRYARYGWMIGCFAAALAGILLAPLVTLNINTLTLLVINGYAAALVGRLRSLPLTIAGALVLGLVQSYAVGYLPVSLIDNTASAIPMVFLLIVLLAFPQGRLQVTSRARAARHKIVSLRESILRASALCLIAYGASWIFSDNWTNAISRGIALSIVLLSVVMLTGYGSQVSLCQLTLAGVGAFTMSKVGEHNIALGFALAIVIPAVIGILIALPALRLRGLYLALTTFAFASAMDSAFFSNPQFFGAEDALNVPRYPSLSDYNFMTFLAVVCAIAAVGVLALRRSSYGRRLIAMGDSPSAAMTLGMNLTSTRLILFAGASGLAGFGGALYGGQQGLVGPADFSLLMNLTLVLILVVNGVGFAAGAIAGGISVTVIPMLNGYLPTNVQELLQLTVGFAAIAIARHPGGVMAKDRAKRKGKRRHGNAQSDDYQRRSEVVAESGIAGGNSIDVAG